MTEFSTACPEDDPHSEDDHLVEVARYLRQGVGQEWRAELEATEIETHQHRLRGRTLQDVATMLAHRGDLVTLQNGQRRFTGEVLGCGRDYLTLNTDSLCVDARLDRFALQVKRRAAGGRDSPGMAPTWRARLTELELTHEPVDLYAPPPFGPRSGRIRVVSVDHLWLIETTGVECYLPLEQVEMAVRPLPLTYLRQ